MSERFGNAGKIADTSPSVTRPYFDMMSSHIEEISDRLKSAVSTAQMISVRFFGPSPVDPKKDLNTVPSTVTEQLRAQLNNLGNLLDDLQHELERLNGL